MCIAILNKKGLISKKTFSTCWDANPDGGGFCYFDGAAIQIIKEMKDPTTLWKKYKQVREARPGIDIAIHFRISTHGKVNETNCHPFRINKRAAFIHNGMINNLERNAELSDTYLFNETILKQLGPNFINNAALLELISGYIGASKLVIISGDSSVIVNEDLGTWDGGNWYSNKSYQRAAPQKYTYIPASYGSNKKSYSGNIWGDSYEAPADYFNNETKVKHKKTAFECECCLEQGAEVSYNYEYNLMMCANCVKEVRAWQ